VTVDRDNIFAGTPEPASNTGYENTATGYQALYRNTSGYRNTASGAYALRDNTEGGYNTAIGDVALYSNTTGSGNDASGFAALNKNTTGIENSATGWNALVSNRSGSYNTAVGVFAGANLGTSNAAGGSANILMGFSAGNNFNANESNNIDIGNLGVVGDMGAIRIGLDANQDPSCATDLACQTATYIAGISGVMVSGEWE
jgi:hypothetical protein